MAPAEGPVWMAIGVQPKTDTIWFDTGVGQSSQWAELMAVWMVFSHEPGPLVICTDSWAVFWDLMLWLPTWKHQNWLVGHCPLWGQAIWQDLWDLGQGKEVTLMHVTGHLPLMSPGNDDTDALAPV